MEYRGKQYSVVQDIDAMWLVPSLPPGIKLVQQALDRALAPKKKRLVPPSQT